MSNTHLILGIVPFNIINLEGKVFSTRLPFGTSLHLRGSVSPSLNNQQTKDLFVGLETASAVPSSIDTGVWGRYFPMMLNLYERSEYNSLYCKCKTGRILTARTTQTEYLFD